MVGIITRVKLLFDLNRLASTVCKIRTRLYVYVILLLE